MFANPNPTEIMIKDGFSNDGLLFKSPINLEFKLRNQDFFFVADGDQSQDQLQGGSEYDHPYRFSDIEMVTVQRYVSLKDVLQSEPPPPEILHMKWSKRDSWREIPIKDPLVQHAARAYLLPMEPPVHHDRKCLSKLKDGCCGFLGFLLNDVVLGGVRRLFGGDKSDDNGSGNDVKVD